MQQPHGRRPHSGSMAANIGPDEEEEPVSFLRFSVRASALINSRLHIQLGIRTSVSMRHLLLHLLAAVPCIQSMTGVKNVMAGRYICGAIHHVDHETTLLVVERAVAFRRCIPLLQSTFGR